MRNCAASNCSKLLNLTRFFAVEREPDLARDCNEPSTSMSLMESERSIDVSLIIKYALYI